MTVTEDFIFCINSEYKVKSPAVKGSSCSYKIKSKG